MGEAADAMNAGFDAPGDRNDDEHEAKAEAIVSEIEATRDDLTGTIQEIGDRLEPGNLARRASDSMRDATMGKVEQMTIGMQETWNDARAGDAGSIVDTIRRNPVPAGMVALGLGMLFMNRGGEARAGSRYRYAAPAYGSDASWQRTGDGRSAMDRLGSRAGDTAQRVGSTAGGIADEAATRAGDMADQVGRTASEMPRQAGQLIDQGAGSMRRMLDENPLGLGIAAMAAGAVIGMLLPSTSVERRTMGETRDQLVDQVVGQAESAANRTLDDVEHKVDEAGS